VVKILGPFEFRKVPESKKYTKQSFFVLQSYNLNKGDLLENPPNNYNSRK
jgi:hypothetical protein